jgi:hypothetical protein
MAKTVLRGNFIVINAYIKKNMSNKWSNFVFQGRKILSPKLAEGNNKDQSRNKWNRD